MENNNKYKSSVVMTTYNGEAYIIEQLESIRNQSLSPTEVIICDDNSNDSTCSLVKNYIINHQLEGWRLYINNPNIGWKKNFYKATQYATGDIIFFSDQDDVWFNEKVEIMTRLMIKYQMDCLYGEKTIIDQSGRTITARMEKVLFTDAVRKIDFSNSFFEKKTLGCCMCISRKVADIYIKANIPNDGHDSQCGRIALLCGSLWHIDRPVIKYRIHEGNTSGISEKASYGQSTLNSRINDVQSSIHWLSRMLEMNEVAPNKKNTVSNCIVVQKKRMDYLNGRCHFYSLLGCYSYYSGFRMLLGDLFYKHHLNKMVGTILWRLKRAQQ